MLRIFIIFLWLRSANSSDSSMAETTVAGYQPLWKYDDESKWPGHRCQAGGRRQSPIDIKTGTVIKDYNRQFIKHGPLIFKGYDRVLVTGINNGHTIQFSTEGEEAIHPTLTGGPLSYYYRLEQLHFHWVSEHAINGIKYPMEMHFVHVRSDLSVYEALSKRDGLAIVAVFCNVKPALDDAPEEVAELMEYIPKLKNVGDRISGVILNMKKLLSPNRTSYFAYSGSLTSPKCNEAVTWIIFTVPIFIRDDQYRLFLKINNGRQNARSLQKISQHVVYKPPRVQIRVPQFVTFFEDVVQMLTNLFKNMTNLVVGIRGG